jgi:hypothetical protein
LKPFGAVVRRGPLTAPRIRELMQDARRSG